MSLLRLRASAARFLDEIAPIVQGGAIGYFLFVGMVRPILNTPSRDQVKALESRALELELHNIRKDGKISRLEIELESMRRRVDRIDARGAGAWSRTNTLRDL